MGSSLIRGSTRRDPRRCEFPSRSRVSSAHDRVGRVLDDYPDRSGLARNPKVIDKSDQGFVGGGHAMCNMRFMYGMVDPHAASRALAGRDRAVNAP